MFLNLSIIKVQYYFQVYSTMIEQLYTLLSAYHDNIFFILLLYLTHHPTYSLPFKFRDESSGFKHLEK